MHVCYVLLCFKLIVYDVLCTGFLTVLSLKITKCCSYRWKMQINYANCSCANCKNKFSFRVIQDEVCETIKTLKHLENERFNTTLVHLAEFLFGCSTK